MTLHDDLIAAKALIDSPSKWCRGHYNSGGFHGFDRHCTLGAIHAASPNFADRDAMCEALMAELTPTQRRRGHALATFNDESDHKGVMQWFDRAIAAASPNRIVTGSEGGM